MVFALVLAGPAGAAEPTSMPSTFPPGWLPIQKLDPVAPAWADFRKIEDKVHLYLPPGVKTYRGVFVCYVFHSQDPRELADAWQFAMVTIPWPFEYDLGHNDKRNGRFKLGHPVGNMGVLLEYLNVAARETAHPELAVAPLVGWVGQNGPALANDLFKRAPDRLLAWTDGFPNRVAQVPELTAAIPFAYAWEFTPNDKLERESQVKSADVAGKPTPPRDLRARANTYGFPHGIYSKYNYFCVFLDRCIKARLPADPPPAGTPVRLRPWNKEEGWAGDFAPVGNWSPVAPSAQATGMVDPQWFPDEYAAWAWRAYHTAEPTLKITAPVTEYRKGGDRKDCGFGFGPPLAAGEPHTFTAEGTGTFKQVEFRDGNILLGVAESPPWKLEGVKLDRGLHAVSAVGIAADGSRSSSRAVFIMVK
jgi:hypothetical protein